MTIKVCNLPFVYDSVYLLLVGGGVGVVVFFAFFVGVDDALHEGVAHDVFLFVFDSADPFHVS